MSGNYIGNEPAPPGVIMVGDTNPVGTIAWFHAVPTQWLRLDGQNAAKATYPDLWLYAQGFLTADQVANPGLFKDIDAAAFALPKLDGLFLRAQGQVDANRASAALGVRQDWTTGVPKTGPATQSNYVSSGTGGTFVITTTGGSLHGGHTFDPETRPVNVALIPCIKARAGFVAPAAFNLVGASQAEQVAGVAADKYVSPAVQQFHKSAAKAWAAFQLIGGVPTILGAFNVASITDLGVGSFAFNFTAPMSSANYAITGAGNNNGATNGFIVQNNAAKTAAATTCIYITVANVAYDPTFGNVAFFGG